MSLKDTRHEFADALKPHLTGWALFPDASNADDITRPTLQIQRVRIERNPQAPQGERLSTFELSIIAPQGTTDDRLDELAEDVLDALDVVGRATGSWEPAERGTYVGKYPAYITRIQIQTQHI